MDTLHNQLIRALVQNHGASRNNFRKALHKVLVGSRTLEIDDHVKKDLWEDLIDFHKIPDAHLISTTANPHLTVCYLFEVEVTSHLKPGDMEEYDYLYDIFSATNHAEMVLVVVDKLGNVSPFNLAERLFQCPCDWEFPLEHPFPSKIYPLPLPISHA